MKRRDFLIQTGLAGMALPGLSWAAGQPCPPPSLSASGGTSSTSACSMGGLPVLRLNGGGPNKPWTFGHPFRKGDVPQYLTASGASAFQADIRNRWSDGSVKFAVVSGIGGTDIQFAPTSTAPSSGGLTEAQLASALPPVDISVGPQTVRLNNLVGTAARQRTVFQGSVMSNWIYRQPLSGGTDMSLWVDVRYYSNGALEIFPWVENGYIFTSSPSNYVGTTTVAIGGSTVFSQANVDYKHRTRIPLVGSSGTPHFVGMSEIIPRHDTTYLKATRLVPNFSYPVSETRLATNASTYVVNNVAFGQYGIGAGMTAAGGAGSVIASPGAQYLASDGDSRAYRGTILAGLSAGAWSIHYREPPAGPNPSECFRLDDYDQLSTFNNGNTNIPVNGSGGTNGSPGATHLPGFAFMPYLLTGRWWFLDELLFWAGYCLANVNWPGRHKGDGIIVSTGAYGTRGAAWSLNTLAHALMVAPTNHPNASSLVSHWEKNCAYYRAKFVTGGSYSGRQGTESWGTSWVSPQGLMGIYSSTGESPYTNVPNDQGAWIDSGFTQNYIAAVFGVVSEYELPVSAQAHGDLVLVRNHAYKHIVARAGGDPGYNWRRFIVFGYPAGEDKFGVPLEKWYTASESYTSLVKSYVLNQNLSADAGLSLLNHTSDTDLNSSASSLTYGASALMALALAVDHGQPGAAAGWSRVTSASNFSPSFGPYFSTSSGGVQDFAVKPRSGG